MIGLNSGMMGGAENLPAPVFVATNSPGTNIGSGTFTTNYPAGTQSGDLALFVITGTLALASVSNVSGASLVYANAQNNFVLFQKVVGPSEPTFTYTATAIGFVNISVAVFRKAEIGNIGTVTESSSAISHSIPTIATTRKNSLVLAHIRVAADSATFQISSVLNSGLISNPLTLTTSIGAAQGPGMNGGTYRSQAVQGSQLNTTINLIASNAISANTIEIRPIP